MGREEWESLLDKNMDKAIVKCYVNSKGRFKNEIFVIYEDGCREVIFSFNPAKIDFDGSEFIGKTKLEAVFYCDRKRPSIDQAYGSAMYSRY